MSQFRFLFDRSKTSFEKIPGRLPLGNASLYSMLFLLCCVSPSSLNAQESNSQQLIWQELSRRSPWVFLGDSNTYSGDYVAMLDAWMEVLPKRPKLLNLGVSSETASGLSEVDHPFKRPCVHERLSKVLAMTKPGVVFVCYGMNDGIYQPRSEENFKAYQDGMLKLSLEVRKSGARLVVLTPPLFEPEPVKRSGKLGPAKNGRYAYFAPAPDYDRVLEEQTQWCLKNQFRATKVINLHEMMRDQKKIFKQEDDKFTFSRDGVHFGALAHGLVAEHILSQIGAPANLIAAYPSDEALLRSRTKHQMLRDAYLTATGKNRPGLPAGIPVWLAEKKAVVLDAAANSQP
ncbi:MAG: GDSL-type esterase/lipase family protein [Planctomycetota bacterium]